MVCSKHLRYFNTDAGSCNFAWLVTNWFVISHECELNKQFGVLRNWVELAFGNAET